MMSNNLKQIKMVNTMFRWIALAALWTILSGPVFGPPVKSPVKGSSTVRSLDVQSNNAKTHTSVID